jgi:nucleoside 2-deoxyribosyltransferase
MPKKAPEEHLMEFCQGCRHANEEANKCEVFIEPWWQWRNNRCWGAAGPEFIYLGGSINGHDTREAANDWREEATTALEDAGYRVLNPLRDRSLADKNSKEIVNRDLTDIKRSSILLVEMAHQDKAYIGTAMEIRFAYERHKKIILWGEANVESHWLKYHSTKRYRTLKEAIEAIKSAKKRGRS